MFVPYDMPAQHDRWDALLIPTKRGAANLAMDMSEVIGVVARFPAHEFLVRRLHASDPEFRVVCRDYDLARQALRHWEAIESDSARAEEYRRWVRELEDEISMVIAANDLVVRRAE